MTHKFLSAFLIIAFVWSWGAFSQGGLRSPQLVEPLFKDNSYTQAEQIFSNSSLAPLAQEKWKQVLDGFHTGARQFLSPIEATADTYVDNVYGSKLSKGYDSYLAEYHVSADGAIRVKVKVIPKDPSVSGFLTPTFLLDKKADVGVITHYFYGKFLQNLLSTFLKSPPDEAALVIHILEHGPRSRAFSFPNIFTSFADRVSDGSSSYFRDFGKFVERLGKSLHVVWGTRHTYSKSAADLHILQQAITDVRFLQETIREYYLPPNAVTSVGPSYMRRNNAMITIARHRILERLEQAVVLVIKDKADAYREGHTSQTELLGPGFLDVDCQALAVESPRRDH